MKAITSSRTPVTDDRDYTMVISRLTIDKLGVKLYDRVSAVVAELIANCYDADAEIVAVRLHSWKCEAPIVKWDDDCYCAKNGCKPAKEGVTDPFIVCNYTKTGPCPDDFKCPPLDQCYKAMEEQQ